MRRRRGRRLLGALLFASVAAAPLARGAPAEGTALTPSEVCAKCHNGTDGSAIVMATSHPVGVDYAQVVNAKRNAYRAADNPAARDLLVDGKVECSSCHFTHDEKTENPYRLRTRDLVKLCTSCHILE